MEKFFCDRCKIEININDDFNSYICLDVPNHEDIRMLCQKCDDALMVFLEEYKGESKC